MRPELDPIDKYIEFCLNSSNNLPRTNENMGMPDTKVFPPQPGSIGECGLAARTSPIPVSEMQSCSEYWSDRLAKVATGTGTLALLASLRDARGMYSDRESEHASGEAETQRVLSKDHHQTLLAWLRMSLEQQSRDLASYFAVDARAAGLARNRGAWIERLTPSGASPQEREFFSHDLCLLLDAVHL